MTIKRLISRHPAGATSVFVGEGSLAAAAGEIGDWQAGRSVFLITTPRVWSLHGGTLARALPIAGDWHRLEVPEGESAKSIGEAERLWQLMLERGGKRDSRAVAFGGGAVGDLTGFVAGCFLRGVEYLQLPTTLLAQVDAALGGKAAVDLPAAKNSVGLFYHPWAVVAETAFLSTLPAAELRAGLLEIIKVGVVLDAEIFVAVERQLERLLRADLEVLTPLVAAAAEAKIALVERDPNERDLRRLLNFGHTLGHALEASLAYRSLRHGEAVGYGMLFALRLACARDLAAATAQRIAELIGRFDLPELPQLATAELLAFIGRDKKATASGPVWVLPDALGSARVVADVTDQEVHRELERFLQDPLGSI